MLLYVWLWIASITLHETNLSAILNHEFASSLKKHWTRIGKSNRHQKGPIIPLSSLSIIIFQTILTSCWLYKNPKTCPTNIEYSKLISPMKLPTTSLSMPICDESIVDVIKFAMRCDNAGNAKVAHVPASKEGSRTRRSVDSSKRTRSRRARKGGLVSMSIE